VDNASTVMGEQHEAEEHAAGHSRNGEEVHRDERPHVIGQERAPGLARRAVSTTEESRHPPR
jgi:hypothetical protein